MKIIKLSKAGFGKIRNIGVHLFENDCLNLSKSFTPGEWIQCYDEKTESYYLGFINLNAEKFRPIIYILNKLEIGYTSTDSENEVGIKWIEKYLDDSIFKRKRFKKYSDNCRLVYGETDNLPGLIVDKYENCILIEINTAGIDRHRKTIMNYFSKIYPNIQTIIHDNPEQRFLEKLPVYSNEYKIDNISLSENNFHFKIPIKRIQKIGYYYDHRNNREKFEKIIVENNLVLKKGLDLFCYIGSWGLHQLRAGVEHTIFVDQGDFGETIKMNLKNNGLENRGNFISSDVFKFLDQKILLNEKFDVITSDPPAFAKSINNKRNALSGYSKLHTKLMKIISAGGLLIINSCTKYISFDELDKTVQEAASKERKKIFLIDIGLQGIDHPMKSLKDDSHYLKYLAYSVEN